MAGGRAEIGPTACARHQGVSVVPVSPSSPSNPSFTRMAAFVGAPFGVALPLRRGDGRRGRGGGGGRPRPSLAGRRLPLRGRAVPRATAASSAAAGDAAAAATGAAGTGCPAAATVQGSVVPAVATADSAVAATGMPLPPLPEASTTAIDVHAAFWAAAVTALAAADAAATTAGGDSGGGDAPAMTPTTLTFPLAPPGVVTSLAAALDEPALAGTRVRLDVSWALEDKRRRLSAAVDHLRSLWAASQAADEFDPAAAAELQAADAAAAELDNAVAALEAEAVAGPSTAMAAAPTVAVVVDEAARSVTLTTHGGGLAQGGEARPSPLTAAVSPAAAAAAVASLRAWVDEVVVPYSICPYTSSSSTASTRLSHLAIPAAPVAYPVSPAASVEALLSSAFAAAAALVATPPEEHSTTLLATPSLSPASFGAYADATAALAAAWRVAGATEAVGLVFFHPSYDRGDAALPRHAPAVGHLPPAAWLAAYLRAFGGSSGGGNNEAAEQQSSGDGRGSAASVTAVAAGGRSAAAASTDAALVGAAQYARRSPVPMVNLLRAPQVAAAAAEAAAAAGGGRAKDKVYARNARRLGGVGAPTLDATLSRLCALAREGEEVAAGAAE
ncbi:hypothetical protein MMPV_000363 [Pyropia vietnamensis]